MERGDISSMGEVGEQAQVRLQVIDVSGMCSKEKLAVGSETNINTCSKLQSRKRLR